jgi:hypothetical protein
MNHAPTRRAPVPWRCLIWLLPVASLIALGAIGYVAAEAARLPASNGWRTFWFAVLVLFASWEVLFLAAGVAATVLARRGAEMAALVVLAAVWAAALWVVGPVDWSHLSSSRDVATLLFSLALAVPVVVAAGLAVVGLLLLRGGPNVVRVVVIALLALPIAQHALSLLIYVVRTQLGH